MEQFTVDELCFMFSVAMATTLETALACCLKSCAEGRILTFHKRIERVSWSGD